jgi:peptidoglycan/xylan/chitin deacetylase (PgdA/CDA1 family)
MSAGGLLLGFDDRHVRSWAAARPLFDRYDARVSLFISHPDLLDDDEHALLRALAADGHTIGAHGLRHRRAPATIDAQGGDGYLAAEVTPCLDALTDIGVTVRSWAYPNNDRNDHTDAVLLERFDRLRAGAPRRDPDTGEIVTDPSIVIDAAEVTATRVLRGRGCDTARGTEPHPADAAALHQLLAHAAESSGFLTLYGHDIADSGSANHTPPARLEEILRTATDLGLPALGLDDLPRPTHVT